MRKFKSLIMAGGFVLLVSALKAQPTFPENGVAAPKLGHYAFTNATIVKDASTTISNGTLIVKDGKIVSVGTNLKVPAGAVEIKCDGKYLYPSFIDIYADYGIPAKPQQQQSQQPGGFFAQAQLNTNIKGPYGWN